MSLKRLLYGGLPLIGGGSYQSVVLGLAPSSLLAYWPLTETSGTQANDVSGNARHGTYSGVTLAQIPGPGGSMGQAGLWDGINDYCDIYTAGLAGAFNGQEGALNFWAKLTLTEWTDGILSRLLNLGADAGPNRILLNLEADDLTLTWRYIAGNTTELISDVTHQNNVDWNCYGLTWSKSADQVKAYFNGAQIGATQTTLGTFTGSLLSTSCMIGAHTAADGFTNGYFAHASLWSTALSAAQMLTLATAR